MSNLHAHVTTANRDCDSTYLNEYVMEFNDSERAEEVAADGINDFSEIHFRERVLCHIMSVYTCVSGTLKVDGVYETGLTTRLVWNETTEEGYRSAEALFCEDDCNTEDHDYRDLTAEAAGY